MKRNLLWSVLAILFLCSSSYTQPDAQSYLTKGKDNISEKNYVKAIGNLTNAISMNPKMADAYYQRAIAKKKLGEKMGYSNNELCYDLTKALRYGKSKAVHMLKNDCMGKCYSQKLALKNPNMVLCADFSSERLKKLPKGSQNLKNVIKLDVFDNHLTNFEKLGKLTTLIQLNASSNDLQKIGPGIGNLEYLKELNCNKNNIQRISSRISNLKNLEALYLRKNKLSKLPASIAQLKNLRTLDLSFNQLNSVPLQIASLSGNLKKLNLVGNDIKGKQRDKIRSLLPNTTVYFE